MLKGTAVIPLADLRELLTDPETRGNARQVRFRFVLNGRVLREFTHFVVSPHQMMFVDATWLITELLQHPSPQDLRIEVTPET